MPQLPERYQWRRLLGQCARHCQRPAQPHLANGASAGLAFEAYDSVYNGYNTSTGQDAPGIWGLWGLFAVDDTNAVNKTYTPRKQFYTLCQITRYVAPGATRIDVSGASTPLTVLAFYNTNNGQFTLTYTNPVMGSATLPMPSGASNSPILACGQGLDGQFQLRVTGPAGQQYSIEASEDLENWSGHITATNQAGTVQLSVPLGADRVFYRARLLP